MNGAYVGLNAASALINSARENLPPRSIRLASGTTLKARWLSGVEVIEHDQRMAAPARGGADLCRV